MGTRADFYVGCGVNAEWLGSVAWDGYEWAESPKSPLRQANNENAYRKEVSQILGSRDDATRPEMGWPWPWKDSLLTDYVYYFSRGKVRWGDRKRWPDMSQKMNTVKSGNRSGIILVGI